MCRLLKSLAAALPGAEIAARTANRFRRLALVTIDGDFGDWKKAQAEHFDEGGTFDAIFAQATR